MIHYGRQKKKNHKMVSCSVNHMLPTIFTLYAFFFCSSLLYCSARDNITLNNSITDERGETLISAGKRFQLGFFTPNESSGTARYVGIWYYNFTPQTVVWVANKDTPLSDDTGVFAITGDGNLNVLDAEKKSYWSTKLEPSNLRRTANLTDYGNLVLSNDEPAENLWASFNNPTDTFLSGMKMDENLQLTSWKSPDDPATGNFTFQRDLKRENQFITRKGISFPYWKSGESGNFIISNEMPDEIVRFLSNFGSNCSRDTPCRATLPSGNNEFNYTRLVMSFTGEIKYLRWDFDEKKWNLVWKEPRDQCGALNACGNFGSCNRNNGLMCKCLPGFEPSSPENWNSGDFSGGCTRKSVICGKNDNSEMFLRLKMVNVRKADFWFAARTESECRKACLSSCECQAYSYNITTARCWIWTGDLTNLQEEYATGDLSVRVDLSDMESTRRNCEICGTYIIPYPLSTGKTCGDSMYFNFHCNPSTGQVVFVVPGSTVAPGSTYRVTSIIPETREFVIQVKDADNCQARNTKEQILQLKQLSAFHLSNWWCNSSQGKFSSNMSLKRRDEIVISWDPPQEPSCTSSTDCKDWSDSTCKTTTKDGQKRCLCNANFQWNSSSLNCTQGLGGGNRSSSPRKVSLSLILAVTIPTVIVLIALSCTTIYILILRRRRVSETQENIQRNQALHLYNSERRLKEFMDSDQFREEDKKGIDVPFFDFGSILVATDNFSDTNKLGKGGFGPVYKGKFSGGQEIAVKRLSSVSGQGLEEFKNEVVLIAKLQHRNLVRLLGYCIEGEEKILLYEYMPNKSLDSFIFDQNLCAQLDWELRFNIILGIARGLLYLHQDSRLRIIHRDLKTSNILLDEEMNPKISDFGLARIFGGKQTEAATNKVIGTYGYMSPEYANYGFFSVKSDVFSFGVVVLEIISGKRITRFYQAEQTLSLLGYAWRLWNEDKALNLMDQTLCETCDTNEFLKCINVGLLCVQEDAGDRPTMSNVVFMLGSETATLPTPQQPAFIVRKDPSSIASSSTRPETWSHNELTTTMEEGR